MYTVRLWRDGQLWRAEVTDRDGRAHALTEEAYTLSTLGALLASLVLQLEQR